MLVAAGACDNVSVVLRQSLIQTRTSRSRSGPGACRELYLYQLFESVGRRGIRLDSGVAGSGYERVGGRNRDASGGSDLRRRGAAAEKLAAEPDRYCLNRGFGDRQHYDICPLKRKLVACFIDQVDLACVTA